MDKPCLRIVLFGHGIGVDAMELAFTFTSGDEIGVVYKDRHLFCEEQELQTSSKILTKDILQKQVYLHVFRRDVDDLHQNVIRVMCPGLLISVRRWSGALLFCCCCCSCCSCFLQLLFAIAIF